MVGQNIGKYRVLDRVGRGGMGTVYRAVDETLHREVAIKVLNAELNDPEVARRFRGEAITVARLSHPGIATIYELFQHDGQWLMVMEFVRGETLEHLAERNGPLAPERSAELCMQALAALAHAHSMGVVHRDLKPANLMVTEAGAIKIMDFGIARVAGTEHLTNAGFMMGTPAYMAPEQVMGNEIDARADLYALGVVFYRLTTAKLPFKGDTPFAMAQSQVNDMPTPIGMFRADLPAWVQQVVVRSLAKNPDERFQSAAEFHESLGRCLAGLPMSVADAGTAPTELMMTPPRAVPTGSTSRTITSAQLALSSQVPIKPPTEPIARPQPADYDLPATMLAPSPGQSGSVGSGPTSAAVPIQGESASHSTIDPTVGVARPATGDIARPVTGDLPRPSTGAIPSQPPTSVSVSSTGSVLAPAGLQTGSVPASPAGPDTAAAMATPAASTSTATTPSLSAPLATASTVKPAALPPARKKSSAGLVAAAVGVAVVLVAGGVILRRSHQAPAPDATSAPAVTPSPPPASTPAVDANLQPAPTPGPAAAESPTASSPTSPAPKAAAAPADAARGDLAAAPTAPIRIPSAGSRAGAAAPLDDTHLAFSDVKVLVVAGKKTDDQDVLLSFVAGQISVLAKKGGNAIASLPYKTLARATYVHARDPKWDDSLPSPPKDLDVGGMLRTSKHWLALQTKDTYVLLRLPDDDAPKILSAVESRTGVTVDRPKSNDK